MLRHSPNSEKRRLRELRAKRKVLWSRFENNPNEIHLAAILKIIDDQIAQSDQRSDFDFNKIHGPELAAVPEVGSLFLLLTLTPRRGRQPDPARRCSSGSTSECAKPGLPIGCISFGRESNSNSPDGHGPASSKSRGKFPKTGISKSGSYLPVSRTSQALALDTKS
jgi:hypothetical protein